MSSSWTNSLIGVGLLVMSAGAAADKFACPEGIGYDFTYDNPDFGSAGAAGWTADIKRAEGASAAGVPDLSVRKQIMRCRYSLPNGAFVLVTQPFPDGTTCVIHQDDYFDPAYFLCE